MARWPYSSPAWRIVRLQTLERDGWLCQIRGRHCTTTATEADHIVAVVDGGHPFDLTNLRAACKKCNSSRGGHAKKRRAEVVDPSRDW